MALSDRHVEDAVERYLAAGDETRAARVVALPGSTKNPALA